MKPIDQGQEGTLSNKAHIEPIVFSKMALIIVSSSEDSTIVQRDSRMAAGDWLSSSIKVSSWGSDESQS